MLILISLEGLCLVKRRSDGTACDCVELHQDGGSLFYLTSTRRVGGRNPRARD